MKTRHFIITIAIGVMGLVGPAQAGHLFTQAGNPSVPLTAGNGVNLTQTLSEGAIPSAASFFSLTGWDSGDVLKLIIGGFTRTFAFDAMPAGWTNISSTFFRTISGTSTSDPALAALAVPLPFVWRVEALAGNFTLDGMRLRLSNRTLDGTGVRGFAVTANAVPEPGTLILFGLGLVGMGLARRRREKT